MMKILICLLSIIANASPDFGGSDPNELGGATSDFATFMLLNGIWFMLNQGATCIFILLILLRFVFPNISNSKKWIAILKKVGCIFAGVLLLALSYYFNSFAMPAFLSNFTQDLRIAVYTPPLVFNFFLGGIYFHIHHRKRKTLQN